MRNLWSLLVLVFGIYGCDQSTDINNNDDSGAGKIIFENGEIVFSNKTLASVCFGDTGGEQLVARVTLTPEGAADLFRLTSENIGRTMTLALDNKIFSRPTIREPIGGKTPIGLIFVSPDEDSLKEMKAFFGVPEISDCQD